jgi:integron integrase
MKKGEIIERVRAVCRTRHFKWDSERRYVAEIGKFLDFAIAHPEFTSSEARVRGWLEDMAPRVAAQTQKFSLNAVVFLFRQVFEKPLGELGQWSKAKIPRRLPVWLSPQEMDRLLKLTGSGTRPIMFELYYGCGLRLMEGVRLRTGDFDLDQRVLTIRSGKRDKDRSVPIPESLVARLAEHLQRVRALWEADKIRGFPPVALPEGMERKFPNAGREWGWFWAFPSHKLSTDPRSRIIRRHHVHEDSMVKALKRAASQAAIRKRITMHCLRHTFATHLLMAGVPINVLQQLLGHESIETTQIYLHVLPSQVRSAPSPLDLLHSRQSMEPIYALPSITSDIGKHTAKALSA